MLCYTALVDLAVSGAEPPLPTYLVLKRPEASRNKIFERIRTVANIKSQKKRIITAEKARMRNRAVRSELKTYVKKVHAAVEAGDVDAAQAAANAACKKLDRAAAKGIIHKNQAADRKSGVQKLVNSMK